MRRVLLVAIVVAAKLAAASPANAAETVVVEVRSGRFVPQVVEIDPGDTVEWRVMHSGHTVTSATFRHPQSGTLADGDVVATTFTERGVYQYWCELHGSSTAFPDGMTGAVYVGVTQPADTPEVRWTPSPEYPTIEHALDGISPGSTVMVEPGTYPVDDELVLATDGLTVQPAAHGEVVLERAPGSTAAAGVSITARSVTVRGITVRGFDWAQVVVDGADGATLDDVRTQGGQYGVRLDRPVRGGINRPVVQGASAAGIAIVGCDAGRGCPHVVDGVVVGGDVGVLIERSGFVSVTGTRVGSTRTAVRVAGSPGALVADNVAVATATAVAVTGPSTDVRALRNLVDAPVGLAWDGLGVGVCFSGNTVDGGGEPTTSPPALQLLFACRG